MTNTDTQLKYRMVVYFSEAKNVFVAYSPELTGCEAEAPSRDEAIRKLEEEISAQMENITQQGLTLPPPIDLQDFNGELSLKISSTLHRELVFLAKMESVELADLITELLTRGVVGRWSYRGGTRGGRQESRGGRMQEGQGSRYHGIMENRADFIEYVRSLETNAGQHNSRDNRDPRGGGRRFKRDR